MKVEFAPGKHWRVPLWPVQTGHWRIFPPDAVADLRACGSRFAERQGQGAELRSRRSELVRCQPARLRAAHSGRRCYSQAEAGRPARAEDPGWGPALKPTAELEGITAPGSTTVLS